MSKDNNTLLELKSISKSYGVSSMSNSPQEFFALHDVSFELKKGEKIGLIGKNGSGKSTLLKIISSLTKPSSGVLTIQGKINSLIEIGSNFIPDLSGRENIKQFLSLNKIAKNDHEALINKIISFSELEDFIDQAIKYYSSGMFVRLAIATGFHINADIYIMDEVLMAGDHAFRTKVSEHFKKITQSETGLLLASHSPKEILDNCSKVLWLEKGKVRYYGDAINGIEKYYDFLAKERSENFYESKVLPFENACRTFNQIPTNELANKYLLLKHLEIKSNSAALITNEQSFDIQLDFIKTNASDRIHPLFKIYDVEMKAILLVISSNNPQAFKRLNKTEKKEVSVRCSFPAKILSAGNYYLEFTAGLNPKPNEKHTKEAFHLMTKIAFTISNENFDFTGATHNIFVKPDCKWEIL